MAEAQILLTMPVYAGLLLHLLSKVLKVVVKLPLNMWLAVNPSLVVWVAWVKVAWNVGLGSFVELVRVSNWVDPSLLDLVLTLAKWSFPVSFEKAWSIGHPLRAGAWCWESVEVFLGGLVVLVALETDTIFEGFPPVESGVFHFIHDSL
jgi:hypothetical protein